MPLSQASHQFNECEVRLITGRTTTIPAGIHPTVSDDLKVRVLAGGSEFDIPGSEFARLMNEGKVKQMRP